MIIKYKNPNYFSFQNPPLFPELTHKWFLERVKPLRYLQKAKWPRNLSWSSQKCPDLRVHIVCFVTTKLDTVKEWWPILNFIMCWPELSQLPVYSRWMLYAIKIVNWKQFVSGSSKISDSRTHVVASMCTISKNKEGPGIQGPKKNMTQHHACIFLSGEGLHVSRKKMTVLASRNIWKQEICSWKHERFILLQTSCPQSLN